MWPLAERNTLMCSEIGAKGGKASLHPLDGASPYIPVSAIYPSQEIAGECWGWQSVDATPFTKFVRRRMQVTWKTAGRLWCVLPLARQLSS